MGARHNSYKEMLADVLSALKYATTTLQTQVGDTCVISTETGAGTAQTQLDGQLCWWAWHTHSTGYVSDPASVLVVLHSSHNHSAYR